ncbi:hypothetical protein [Rhodococcus koreensis]|uniref:Uncharacterized protein n=1 Tax=Rhodococcus koreensis TaxID=99653 RepID=A0A1H4IBY3_9NOCA|nr:hypothetical protein [Rhodococcus koreensis]SEB31577.1 hypothetical protein SAMN04490239_0384 [Rhodococcus koreensis]
MTHSNLRTIANHLGIGIGIGIGVGTARAASRRGPRRPHLASPPRDRIAHESGTGEIR